MFKNYLKTAWRSLLRNKQFSIINVVGLALGITVFLFIMQHVAFEWSANRFNKDYNHLYRTNVQYKDGSTDYYLPPGFAQVIKQQFPVIENYVRIADDIGDGVITYNDNKAADSKVLRGGNIKYADGNFLSVFSFTLLSGTPSLDEPKTLALSEIMSQKLFSSVNAAGKTVTVSNQFGNTLYTVKAVYALPNSSDIKPDVLLSFKTLESPANRNGNDWADPNTTENGFTSIYLQLREDANSVAFSKRITKYVRSINPASKDDVVYLQPFSELHLAPSFNYPYQTFGNILLVFVFACIAVLIIFIAWLNYINLSTAQALNRSKEVGVRKILGASRSQLMFQHLTETLLLTITSTLIALLLVNIFQNKFNQFSGEQLSLEVLNNGWFLSAGIIMIIAGSFLSGSYVAFVITSFKPLNTIRSKGQIVVKSFSVRKALVVFQFTASIVFIIATVVLYNQLQFMRNENLGMNLNQLLVVKGPTVASEDQAVKNVSFKNTLRQLPFVKKYAASNSMPGIGYNFFASGITGTNETEADKKKSYGMFICDQNFFDTYGISFAQGNTFSANDAERSWNNVKKVIINEKAAQQFGFNLKENIIGKKIKWGDAYEIIGVVKDYHHLSLREPIQPGIYLGSVGYSFFTVQTDSRNLQSKVATLRNLYNKAFPGNPFEYFFADEKYDEQYTSEQRLGKVFIAAASVAIIIACLGLFGLSAFSAKQRIKEIGIRKVLGASVAGITSLLSRDFIKLVLIAFIIASPIAWWAMNKWLQSFAYKASISIWIFIVSGLVAVVIALVTISFQSIKAAIANPVKSLRTE